MAVEIGELLWQIKADTADINKKLKQSEDKAKTTGKKLAGVATAIKASFAAAAVVGIGKISLELIKAASAAEETRNKFNVTFGDVRAEADKTAQNLASSFGLSQQASQELLSDTGDLLTGFGFTAAGALDLSEQVNKLAVDLASFTNFSGGAKGASAALTKALLGERESIKSLGISIQEADIKQLAEDKGIVGALDRQTKAALTLELALKQSKNAIGDFARSQDSFANQSRIAEAAVQDFQVALGNILLPTATKTLKFFNEEFVPGIENLFETLSEIPEPVQKGFKTLFEVIKNGAISALGPVGSLINIGRQLIGNTEDSNEAIEENTKETEKNNSAKKESVKLTQEQKNALAKENAIKKETEQINKDLEKSLAIISEKQKLLGEDYDGSADKVNVLNDSLNRLFELGLSATDPLVEKFAALRAEFQAISEATLTAEERQKMFIDTVFQSAETLVSSLSSISSIMNSLSEDRIEQIEAERDAALEAAGVREETEIERLQAELEAAKAAGDEETANEKEIALGRAQINAEFDKKIAEQQYKAALSSWKLDLLNANALAAVAVSKTFASVPYPANIPLGIAQGVASSFQVGAVLAAKPDRPRLATGAIVKPTGGGADVTVAENGNEEGIFNAGSSGKPLVRSFVEEIKNAMGIGAITIQLVADGIITESNIYKKSRDGLFRIAPRAFA